MKLYYVPKEELDKITDNNVMLDALRLNLIYMVMQAGSGHLGGSLSSLTIMVPLFFGGMGPEDVFITSKGHDAPALYAILQAKGIIPFDTIHTLRRPGGLPGHPTIDIPGVLFNTGSLGMGISKANGLAAADRLTPMFYPATGETKPRQRKIHVLVGDGELQEGQNWEAAAKLDENVVIHVDKNNFGLSCIVVVKINGVLPKNIIFHDTIKGDGISFMKVNNKYHAGALSEEEYEKAFLEVWEPGMPSFARRSRLWGDIELKRLSIVNPAAVRMSTTGPRLEGRTSMRIDLICGRVFCIPLTTSSSWPSMSILTWVGFA